LNALIDCEDPADRYHGRLVGGIVQGAIDGIDETGVAVRREIHGDARARRDRARDLDVERHLAIGAVRIAGGRVRSVVDANRYDFRRLHAELREVRGEIGVAITAAQLDDRDALAGAVAVREVVEAREIDGRKRRGRRAPRRLERRPETEMRTRLRLAVEAQHGGHGVVHVVGHEDLPCAAAIFADVVMLKAFELDVESLLELFDGALQHHAARLGFGAHDRQAVLLGEGLDLVDICLGCGEPLVEFVAGDGLRGRLAGVDARHHLLESGFVLAPQHHDHFDLLGKIAGADAGCAFGMNLVAAADRLLRHGIDAPR
jgi:hypothetical protein